MKISTLDLRQTNAYTAVMLRRIFFGPIALVIGSSLLAGILWLELEGKDSMILVTLTCTMLFGAWILFQFRRFLRTNHALVSLPENIAEALSYHMVEHLMNKASVTPTTLLESALESERGIFVLQQMGIERPAVLSAWAKRSPEDISIEICFDWILHAKNELQTTTLDSTATIYGFFCNVLSLQAELNTVDLSIQDLRNIVRSEAFHYEEMQRRKNPFSPESIARNAGSIGRSWATGYNTELERVTTNLSEHVLQHAKDAVAHSAEVERTFESLASSQHKNLLLIGRPGSGKRTMVRNLAVTLRKHEIKRGFGCTDILILKSAMLISGTEASDRYLLRALDKASASGKFIIVIEDLSLLLASSDPRLKNVLVALLEAKNLRTIGVATNTDYHRNIKTEPSLSTLFETVYIPEANDDETMKILLEEYFKLERKRKIRITYKALRSIVDLSQRYIGSTAMPGKAVDILQEAVSVAKTRGLSTIDDVVIRDIVSAKAHIDVRGLRDGDKQKLLLLEDRLRLHVIGQEEAIQSIVNALKRGRLDIGNRKKPIGTFLFLGTTGVGKTETAKALAEEYFGSETHITRIDMNEYSNENSITMLIGGENSGKFTEGILTKCVQDRPFSLILLDEIEKAHPKVLNAFLQILDEGTLIDGTGEKADFRNTIIIATSNAGSHWMASIDSPARTLADEEFRKALLETIIDERTLSPEFVNRFDDVIVFRTPTSDDIERIAILMLDDIIKGIRDERGITIAVEQGVVDILAKKGYDPTFGAREMRRTITKTIENYLANYLLTHAVKRGDEIVIRKENVLNV